MYDLIWGILFLASLYGIFSNSKFEIRETNRRPSTEDVFRLFSTTSKPQPIAHQQTLQYLHLPLNPFDESKATISLGIITVVDETLATCQREKCILQTLDSIHQCEPWLFKKSIEWEPYHCYGVANRPCSFWDPIIE